VVAAENRRLSKHPARAFREETCGCLGLANRLRSRIGRFMMPQVGSGCNNRRRKDLSPFFLLQTVSRFHLDEITSPILAIFFELQSYRAAFHGASHACSLLVEKSSRKKRARAPTANNRVRNKVLGILTWPRR